MVLPRGSKVAVVAATLAIGTATLVAGASHAAGANRPAGAHLPVAAIVSSATVGGSATDTGRAVAVDGDGNVYVTGETSSADFPIVGAKRWAPRGAQLAAFVAKLDPHGRVIYETVLGGSRTTAGHGIAVDGAGRAYVTGATSSTDFPTTPGALQRSYGGGPFDAFVTVLDPSGRQLVYSTFLGDTHYDEANAIAVDRAGRAVITGRTASPQFPRAGGLRPAVAGGAFVAKLARDGSRLSFSAVFGGEDRGNHGNTGFGVAVDAAGSTYATGVTNAPAFPTAHPLQRALGGGADAFVVKIDPAGRHVVYATYLGGTGDDSGRAIAADPAGNAYVAGVTSSSDFPWREGQPSRAAAAARAATAASAPGGDGATSSSAGAVTTSAAGDGAAADAFVAKLGPNGRTLAYATRLGGSGDDEASAIAVDAHGDAFVGGRTSSASFPLVAPVRRSGTAFLARVARGGTTTTLSTRLGALTSAALGLAIDRFGAVAVTGAAGTRSGSDAFIRVLAPDRRTQLRRQLVPLDRAATVGRLLAHGGVALRFAARSRGEVRVSWYAGRALVARGRAYSATPGVRKIAVRLTAPGRRLLQVLRGALTLTARGRLTRAGAAAVEATTTFVVRGRSTTAYAG